ncbi:dihydroorotate dehydrogenase electron transfer subunit [Paucidesulfovibrio gracilis DSM 16080]|uniref:Dihydroorotate dehydrogenase electron transfer subunit n=2 Tax=Paucidesulfovibrio TaxID=2910985 RepID=A0A1T4WS77_9BACT|nr:dihydroorotate dehydrogenase electron transfer subunit [Paucidesulfovibrio gracilis DSM 16080]
MVKKVCREVSVGEVLPIGQSVRPGEFFELRLENPGWSNWRPGQFVMIRPSDWDHSLLWGRPFSIGRVQGPDGDLSIFFQNVGRGTARMAQLSPGDKVVVWGPLGNGFAVEPDTPTLLLAGGIGIAPFVGYMEAHPTSQNVELVFAHRLPVECYPYTAFSQCPHSCLEENSSDDLPKIIKAVRDKVNEYRDGLILCCGPTPFMRTVRTAALEFGARAQLSLENRMACGVGACLGCVCQDGKGHHVQTCTRGPVFWATDVTL